MAKGYKGGKKGSQAGMMGQLQALQEQLMMAQDQLAEETVTASAGGGVIKVTVTGDQRCTEIVIDPELLEDVDAVMLQDLLLAAFNSALDQSRQLAVDRLGPLAGSGLPF